MTGVDSETDCTESLQELYQSLLGAAVFALLTRLDAAVYLVALQRQNHQAKVIHVKRLNAVVRWMQRNPRPLVFGHITETDTHLRMVSDSAFKKEDENGHALKGALFLRVGTPTGPQLLGDTSEQFVSRMVHVLDYICKTQRHVTRSTFGAELFAACDTIDHGLLLATILHQVNTGACSVTVAKELREHGGWKVRLLLALDAMSVFAAATATQVKVPAEKSLLSHVQYLRELLDLGILEQLSWWDTRDMVSDGLTKGSVDRIALHAVMQGFLKLAQPVKVWSSKLPSLTPNTKR
jgi:hypothetical protein